MLKAEVFTNTELGCRADGPYCLHFSVTRVFTSFLSVQIWAELQDFVPSLMRKQLTEITENYSFNHFCFPTLSALMIHMLTLQKGSCDIMWHELTWFTAESNCQVVTWVQFVLHRQHKELCSLISMHELMINLTLQSHCRVCTDSQHEAWLFVLLKWDHILDLSLTFNDVVSSVLSLGYVLLFVRVSCP